MTPLGSIYTGKEIKNCIFSPKTTQSQLFFGHEKIKRHVTALTSKNRAFNLTAQRCRPETEKFILKDIFCSVFSKFEKCNPY